MRTALMAAVIIGVLVSVPARAQEAAPGRYAMAPVDGGMLRLDTQTGAVSHCTGMGGNWVCKSVADDRLALEAEIDRLISENRRLRAELDDRKDDGPDGLPDTRETPPAPRSWLPDDRHVDEFMAFFEKLMRRFKSAMESLKDEHFRREL